MADKIHDSEEDATTQEAETCDFKKVHIGQNIAAIRRSWGISQEYVAAKLGKSQQTVSSIESMENIPEEQLDQIAKILGVSPDFILNYDLEKVITSNTQIVNDGGRVAFNDSSTNTTTNSLDVIQYVVSENAKLHLEVIKEKNDFIRELKAEIKLLKVENKRLNEEMYQSRKK